MYKYYETIFHRRIIEIIIYIESVLYEPLELGKVVGVVMWYETQNFKDVQKWPFVPSPSPTLPE